MSACCPPSNHGVMTQHPIAPRRLLFTSTPAYGHLLPMLPLMRAALEAGHEVRVATGPDFVRVGQARGLHTVGVGPSWDDLARERTLALASSGLPDGHPGQTVVAVRAIFGRPAALRLTGLRRLAGEWRPDLVVHEPLELAGPMLARELDVPSVLHGYGPMFPEYAELGPVVAEAAGDPELWGHLLGSTVLDICPPALRPDLPALWPGALDLRPTAGESAARGSRLDVVRQHDRLAYVTLGTISATADALRSAIEAVSAVGLDVVATTGPALDPATLGPLPAGVSVHRYLPQTLVLQHADVLVSQAGAGTMLGALCHGLPQVCVPLGADQALNARAVAQAGAGLVLEGGDPVIDAGSLAAAVETVLADPGYARGARRVRAQIRRMPAAAVVLPELVRDLVPGVARLDGAAS